MRPGQNRRVRGRMNRKGPNPLTRSYESNGPDVKIRGTAQHIAEKYTQLARDAQVAGDPVACENYLQHAEHYFRIIAAAQAQMQQAYGHQSRGYDEFDDIDPEDDFADPLPTPRLAQAVAGDEAYPAGAPQPHAVQRERAERQDRAQRYPASGERQARQGDNGEARPDAQRHENGRADGEPRGRRERFRRQRDVRMVVREGAEAGPAGEADVSALPAFLTTPARPAAPADAGQSPPVAGGEGDAGDAPAAAPVETAGEENGERFPTRTRRRGRGRGRVETAPENPPAEQGIAS